MGRMIKTEFCKLKRYFIVWTGIALMLLNVLLTLFTSIAEDGIIWDFLFLYEQVIKNLVTLIFPMCITLVTGYMIAREYTDGTLKNIAVVPVSSVRLLAGKLLVAGVLSLLFGFASFLFATAAAFALQYDGLTLWVAFIGAAQMTLIAPLLFLVTLPIIVLMSRKPDQFLAGVIVSFVYGFVGMFAGGPLACLYPVSAALGLINYRGYAAGVSWNVPLCALSVAAVTTIGIALMFVRPGAETHGGTADKKRVTRKKGW